MPGAENRQPSCHGLHYSNGYTLNITILAGYAWGQKQIRIFDQIYNLFLQLKAEFGAQALQRLHHVRTEMTAPAHKNGQPGRNVTHVPIRPGVS